MNQCCSSACSPVTAGQSAADDLDNYSGACYECRTAGGETSTRLVYAEMNQRCSSDCSPVTAGQSAADDLTLIYAPGTIPVLAMNGVPLEEKPRPG